MIYVIQAGEDGPVKIGYVGSRHGIPDRIEKLQVGNATRLRFLFSFAGDYAVEAMVHRRWRTLKIRGEWFEPSAELLQYLELASKEGFYLSWPDVPESGILEGEFLLGSKFTAPGWRRIINAHGVLIGWAYADPPEPVTPGVVGAGDSLGARYQPRRLGADTAHGVLGIPRDEFVGMLD